MGAKKDAPAEADMYDISDVTFDIKQAKNRREISLIARSESDFNLFKYYLSLEAYLEKIRHEIGLMEEAPEVQ